jgi:hypothetical protein
MKRKIIVPKSVSQHVEEESWKTPEFRKAYDEEVTRLQIGYKDHSVKGNEAFKSGRTCKKGQYYPVDNPALRRFKKCED